MPKSTILIMYSWDDFISQRRYRIISESPLMRQFNVRQCFALDYDGDTTSESELTQRLDIAFKKWLPEIFLMHTGVAFKRNHEIFLSALAMIHSKYPTVRLGFEPRPDSVDVCERSGLFEKSVEMEEIIDLFFTRVFERR